MDEIAEGKLEAVEEKQKKKENKGPSYPLWKYKETSHRTRRRYREMRESSTKPGEVEDADCGSVGFKCFHFLLF